MALFRGGLLIASLSGYSTLHGLVSYNHFAFSDSCQQRFFKRTDATSLSPNRSRVARSASPCSIDPEQRSDPIPSTTFRPWNWRCATTTAKISVCRFCYGSTST
jgi:hypothetical protein